MPLELTHEYIGGGLWLDRSVRAMGGDDAVREARKWAGKRIYASVAKREILEHYENKKRDT